MKVRRIFPCDENDEDYYGLEVTIESSTNGSSKFLWYGLNAYFQFPQLDGDVIKIWVQDPTVGKSLQFMPYRFDLEDHAGVDSLINKLDAGRWVGVMIIGNLVTTPILSRAFGKLGGCKIANYAQNINYCLIGHKGSPSGTAQEDYGDYRRGQQVTVTGEYTLSLSVGTKNILFSSDKDGVIFGLYKNPPIFELEDGVNVITFGKEVIISDTPDASLQTFQHSTLLMIIAKGSAISSMSNDALTAIQRQFRSQMIQQFSKQRATDSTWMMLSRIDKFLPMCEAMSSVNNPFSTLTSIIVEPIGYDSVDDRTDPLTPTNGVGNLDISVGTCNPITSGPHQEYGFLYTYVNNIPIIYDSNNNAFYMTVINEVTGYIFFTRDLVIICSTSPSFQSMPIDLAFAFSTLGAQSSYDITSSSSYALIGRKGSSPGSVPERISNTGAVALYSNFDKPMKILKPFIDIQSHSKPSVHEIDKELDDMSKFSINGVTVKNAQCLDESTTASNDFVRMLQQQVVGTIVVINTCGKVSNYLSNEAKTKIVDILGGSAIKSFDNNQSYSIIASVIDPSSPLDSKMVSESMSPAKNPSSTANICHIMINGDLGKIKPGVGLNVAIIDPDLVFPSSIQRFMFNTHDDPSQWSTFYTFILSLKSDVRIPTHCHQTIDKEF
eukprot:gene13232-15546_t